MPITLTTPYQVSGPPGEPTETDAYIAVAGISVDQIFPTSDADLLLLHG